LKRIIFMALFLIPTFYFFSCVSTGIDGRYAVDLEETKKNIVDDRQRSIFSMVKSGMSVLEFEIQGSQVIWYVNDVVQPDVSTIETMNGDVLIIADKNSNDKLELKHKGGKLLIMDPVMGIYIVFTKKQVQR